MATLATCHLVPTVRDHPYLDRLVCQTYRQSEWLSLDRLAMYVIGIIDVGMGVGN